MSMMPSLPESFDASTTPTSVIMPRIKEQGVTSKDGFQAAISSGAILIPKIEVSSV